MLYSPAEFVVPEPTGTQESLPVKAYDRVTDWSFSEFPFESESRPFMLTAEPTAVDGAFTEMDIWVDVGVGVGVGLGLGEGLGVGVGVGVGTSSNEADIVWSVATLTNV